VSEGSGENIFVIDDGKIYTPPVGSSILRGVTRTAALTIARDLGIPVVEQNIPRELLYIADEVFFTGTAAEITPIRSNRSHYDWRGEMRTPHQENPGSIL
jgi:branched-chain amino acid aminotransferase